MAKRISELDVATSVSDADYIPCVQGGVTKRATRAALYPDDVPVGTSSRIIDLTGDRAPAIPDDPAGVTYLQDEWATTDGWGGVNATLSVSGGSLVVTANTGGVGAAASKYLSSSNKLYAVRVKCSVAVGVSIRVYTGSATNILLARAVKAGVWEDFSAYANTSIANIQVVFDATAAGQTLEIDWVYLGTGAYLSKLVDRAGVPWTNNGALPVDGPFGKGLQFNGAQYLRAPGPMIGTTGTVAIWFSFSSVSSTQVIYTNRAADNSQGHAIILSGTGLLLAVRGATDTNAAITIKSSPAINTLYKLVYTFDGTTVRWTLEDTGISTVTLAEPAVVGANVLWVGSNLSAGTPFTGTIYAFRADSRVWTDDEIARWSRDPYSEDSGLVDAFSLDFTNLPTFADNAAAVAGNLPAGKLYRTSTGNVLVRY